MNPPFAEETLAGSFCDPSCRKDSAAKQGCKMRKAALWVGVPAVVGVLGVSLWFTLVPGRSGAG